MNGIGIGIGIDSGIGGFKLPDDALQLSPTVIGTLLQTNGTDDVCIFEVEDLYLDINRANTITLEWDGRFNITSGLSILTVGYGGGTDNGDGFSLSKNPTTNIPVLTIVSETTKQTIAFTAAIAINTYHNLKVVIDKVGLTAKLYNYNSLIESKDISAVDEFNLTDSKVYLAASNPSTGFTAFQTGRIKISTNLTTILTADSSQANEKFWFCSDGKNNHGIWNGTGTKLVYHKDAPTEIINGFSKWVDSAGNVINVPHTNGVKQDILAFTYGAYQEALDYPQSLLYNQAPVLVDFANEATIIPLLTNTIINGTFDSATGWVGGTISGGTCSFTASGGGIYRSDIPFVQNHRYVFKVKFSAFTAGSCGIRMAGAFIAETMGFPNTFNAAQTYYVYYTHTAASGNIKTEIRVRATFSCVMDEFLCYDLNETTALSLMDRANETIHNATSIAAKPDAFFTYRWKLSELDYRTYKGYYNNDYLNKLFAKATLRQVSSEYDISAITDIRYFVTAPTGALLSSMINWIGFSNGLDLTSPVTIANSWDAAYVYPDIILGAATGSYEKDTFTYSSSIDAINNLYGKYNYDDGFTKQPILLLCHGWSSDADIFSDAEFQNYSSKGFFVVALGLRGRNSASGTLDASGREIQDIIDGINYIRTTFAAKVSSNRNIIVGFSGGGGNTYNAITKNPDTFAVAMAYFGMTDYGESETDSWRITDASYATSIIAAIGDVTEVDKYKARNVRTAALNYNNGWLYGFAKEEDALVNYINTVYVKDLFESSALSNYEFDISNVIYGHGNYSAARINDVQIKAKYKPAWIYPTSGTISVRGYIKTKLFSIVLDDMMSSVVTVNYNTTTRTYQITPVTTGNITIAITQGVYSYSGVINGNITIVLT